MRVFLYKQNEAFHPADDDQREKLKRIKERDLVEVELKKPRNIKFHRKYFALLNTIFEQQEKYTNRNHFRTDLQIRAGHYDEHITDQGEVIYMPKSISFASMDEHAFSDLYNNVLDICLRAYLPDGYSADDINKMVEQRLRFS